MTPAPIKCKACSSLKTTLFYKIEQVPVNSVLLIPDKFEATNISTGDVSLAFCNNCGFIFNAKFNPIVQEYSSRYDPTQGFSSTFNTFHKKLATSIIEKYNLNKKKIIEIGCGKGEFLHLLCEMGDNQGIGFDPAYTEDHDRLKVNKNIKFIRDFYSEKYAYYSADFICCKMTLEHIQDVYGFLNILRNSLDNNQDAIVFFQVPDVERILQEIAFWDIYYEHCSYFSRSSLAMLFNRAGFQVRDVWNDYGNQYLMIEAQISKAKTNPFNFNNDTDSLMKKIDAFQKNFPIKRDAWKEFIKENHKNSKKIVLWGGGSKGVAFLTTLNIINEIEYVVDINPHRDGTYMAKTGQKIVSPIFLRKYKPDIVIIMNPIYKNEIRNDLKALGLQPEIFTVLDH